MSFPHQKIFSFACLLAIHLTFTPLVFSQEVGAVPLDTMPLEMVEAVVTDQNDEAQKYFEWHAVDAGFRESAIGRSYATVGTRIFAIGGRLDDGTLLDTVEILELEGDGSYSHRLATLAEPVAFSAIAEHDGKLYLVGGLSLEGPTAQVRSLEWVDDGLIEKSLPPLPAPVMLAGATIHRSTVHHFLYILGGVHTLDATEASALMYEMRLSDLEEGEAVWQSQPDMPFGGRVAPTVIETYNEVVVVGGYTFTGGQALTPTASTWGYSRVPRDGHVTQGWEQRADFYSPVAFPAASKTGQSHLTLVGGDSAGGSLAELLHGTKAQALLSQVLAFHDPTDTWHAIGATSMPTVGGALLEVTSESYILVDAQTTNGQVVASVTMDFLRTTKRVSWIDWLVIAAYFAIVAWIGFRFAKKQSNAESFALGNRSVKWWASAISMMATGVSTISFMAIPALVACIGFATQGPMIFSLIGVVLSAFFTYPMLRRLKITSTYEYVEQRFGLSLRLLGSFNSIIVQMMGRIGIVVMLPALAISTMTGIDPWISILVMGLLTTLYSTAGGFEAVIWTDVVQGILMLIGFTAIGVMAFANINGGWDAFISYGTELDRLRFWITEWDVRVPMVWFSVLGFILGFMAFASDQATAQRVLAIPLKDVRKLAFLSGSFGVIIAYMAGAVGLGLFGFFKSNPEYLSPVMKNDQMVPLFIVSKIPVGLSGLLLATLFAASMSTISSSVNVCAVLFGEDFYKRFRKGATSKEEMRVMQVVSLLTGLIGTGIAIWLLNMDLPTLWESFMRIMAFVGGGFAGVYILGMFTQRTHELGAIIGVISSFGCAYYLNIAHIGVHWSALSVLVVTSCVATGYLSSLIIPWKRKNLVGLTVWDQIRDADSEDS